MRKKHPEGTCIADSIRKHKRAGAREYTGPYLPIMEGIYSRDLFGHPIPSTGKPFSPAWQDDELRVICWPRPHDVPPEPFR